MFYDLLFLWVEYTGIARKTQHLRQGQAGRCKSRGVGRGAPAGRGQAIAPTMDALGKLIQRSHSRGDGLSSPCALQKSHTHPAGQRKSEVWECGKNGAAIFATLPHLTFA